MGKPERITFPTIEGSYRGMYPSERVLVLKVYRQALKALEIPNVEIRRDYLSVVAGQQVAKAAGKHWGGSRRGRRITVTDDQIQTMRRLYDEETPIAAIARATGLSRPTVYSHLFGGKNR